MSHYAATTILSAIEKAYCSLLSVYPETHRRAYGPLMVQLFRDLCRDSYQQAGWSGLLRLCFHVLLDTAASAATEHAHLFTKEMLFMTRKQHRLAISTAAFPLGLWLVLLLLNPNFASRLVMPALAQPIGWIMMAAVLLLSGIAYLTQRRGFMLSSRSGSPSGVVSATALRSVLFVFGIVLFVVPATFLVVFGPAIMLVLEAGF